MSNRKHHSFGSTPNFPNLYKQVVSLTDPEARFKYANWHPDDGTKPTDEQKELLASYIPEMPILTFTGSEKLHGENMAVAYSGGEIWVQGRNHIRTLLGDQNGMAAYVEEHKAYFYQLLTGLASQHELDFSTHTIVLDGEWAGDTIQKGNAACSGTAKAMYMFDYYRIINNDTGDQTYHAYPSCLTPSYPVYHMSQFHTWKITLDFANPRNAEHSLKLLAEHIESTSPIAAHFDKPKNVGEGAYLWCEYNGEMLRLKTKGEKHGGKPKQTRKPKTHLTDEQQHHIQVTADLVTPVWRITQAITETNATERKDTGAIIGWVIADIVKEEMPALISAKLTIREISATVANIVRNYYFDYLKDY